MNPFELIKVVFKGIFQAFSFLLPLLFPVLLFFVIIIIIIIYNILYLRYVKVVKPKKRLFPFYFSYNNKKYVLEIPRKYINNFPNVFKNIFVLFPKQFDYDFLNQDPNAFGEFGIHIVTGEQGAGKTITVVYLLEKWRSMYPRLKVYTNMAYKYEDGELTTWRDLLTHNNGIYGVVNVIDELKTWWSNKDSKDVPPEVLGEICQQRKQKKATIGTVQVFSELAKPFRSQTHYIYVPKTFFGCLTVVFKTKAKYYDSENDTFKKYCGFFIFAHTKKIRNAYDTYKKIEKYKDIDFAESNAFVSGGNDQTTPVVVVPPKKGLFKK